MYANLAALRDAYATGALSRDDKLCLDNDHASVWRNDDATTESVFALHPHDVLTQALDLLGIPWGYP